MKTLKMLSLCIAIVSLLSACGGGGSDGGGNNPGAAPTSSLIATGGTGSTGSGGRGGYLYIGSTGAVKVLKSGSVDASFTVSAPTPSFGANHVIVSGGTTTVQLDADAIVGGLYVKTGDPHLYLGNGNGILTATDDAVVTGLTINAGATLVLVDQGYSPGAGAAVMTNDLVVNGTLSADTGKDLSIGANLIDVESGAKITTSATAADANAAKMYIGDSKGITGKIINKGTIEAKGHGSGAGGYVALEAADLIVNYGTIDSSNSSTTGWSGAGGNIDIIVDYGNFYSSGTVRANGGDADNGQGSQGGQVNVYTANTDNTHNMNGDIIVSGVWELNGGNCTNCPGGQANWISFVTYAMGNVAVNAAISTRGGKGIGANGGNAGFGGIYFTSYNYGSVEVTTPGKIRISGTFDVRGGNGDNGGGDAGTLDVEGYGANSSFKGVDVELVGFPSMVLDGGAGSNGTNANRAELYTYAPQYPNIFSTLTNTNTAVPAGSITNEATISLKGGAGTTTSGSGYMGGSGGQVYMKADLVQFWWTGNTNPSVYNATTVINNSGSIDASGATGDVGGWGGNYAAYLLARHVTNSGNVTATGGNGTTTGGKGGAIYLMSLDHATKPTTNTGALSVTGGSGGTTNGANGTKTVDGSVI